MNPVLVLLAASVLWGCTWWPLKQVAALGVSGLPQILVANLVATLLVMLWLCRQPSTAGDRRWLLAIVLLGGGANVAFSYSLIHGTVVRVMVLFYLLPVWGVLGGRLFLGERVDSQRLLAVACALGGAFLVLGGPAVFAAPPSWIDLLALASGFLFALNNLCFRASPQVPIGQKVGAMFAGSALLAGSLLMLGFEQVPDAAASIWLLAAALGILLVIVTTGSQYGVTHLEAGRSSVIIIMELVTAVITAAWWAGETMNGIEWLGGALILAAALLEAWRPGTAAD